MKLSRKAFGYFLQHTSNGTPQLLALSFAAEPGLPLRFPGGTLHENEDPLIGLFRELREETGLTELTVIRKLGVQHYYKPYIQADVERHDYLVQASAHLPESFSHVVQGDGGDSGEVFNYRWIGSDEIDQVDWEFRKDMTREYLPEFFIHAHLTA
jgi:8-oxo-dGTP pyrophosphatase MutT (NUDIX family)